MTDRKVIFITPGCFDKGGISRYSRYQISALRDVVGAQNLRVYSLLGPNAESFEDRFDVHWHGKHANNFGRFKMAARLISDCLFWKPDVIHSAHVNFSPLLVYLKSISRALTVLNVYGLELWSGLSHARAEAMRYHDLVISDCHATSEFVAASGMHPRVPETIWDCVDLDRYRPGPRDPRLAERYGLPPLGSFQLVMTLGRIAVGAEHKGYDRLIEAFPAILAQVPNARLVIAGEGNDRRRLMRVAEDAGLADFVFWTGAVHEADLPGLYRMADVFSLVSDVGFGRGEGIPLTPLEAMACGVPIVVGNEDGSREAVDGHRNGRVVSPRRPEEIISAIVELLGTDRDALAHEARAVAEERFGYAAFREKHRDIYGNLLGI